MARGVGSGETLIVELIYPHQYISLVYKSIFNNTNITSPPPDRIKANTQSFGRATAPPLHILRLRRTSGGEVICMVQKK
jgi:hypothetical protein